MELRGTHTLEHGQWEIALSLHNRSAGGRRLMTHEADAAEVPESNARAAAVMSLSVFTRLRFIDLPLVNIIVLSNNVTFFFCFNGEGEMTLNIAFQPLTRIMVNHRISCDSKERAICLHGEMDLRSIAHVLNVSTCSKPVE